MPIKLLAASRKRPGLTRAEYQRYLEFYHGTIARQERLKIASYVQNHVLDGAFGRLSDPAHLQVADRDAVVELSFDNFQDLLSTLEPAVPSAASQDGKVFDSTWRNSGPATLRLGEVIRGWTEGLQLMEPGEKVRLWVPEKLAYRGQDGMPRGTLVFDIELMETGE